MRVVAEHRFGTAADLDAVRGTSSREARRVRSLVSADGVDVLSLYDAVSPGAVVAVTAGLAASTRVWPAFVLGDPIEPLPSDGMRLCVVERVWDPPTSPEDQRVRRYAAQACLDIHRVRPVSSHVAQDGTRQSCTFVGPDVESVRTMSRRAADPFVRIWAVHGVLDGDWT